MRLERIFQLLKNIKPLCLTCDLYLGSMLGKSINNNPTVESYTRLFKSKPKRFQWDLFLGEAYIGLQPKQPNL